MRGARVACGGHGRACIVLTTIAAKFFEHLRVRFQAALRVAEYFGAGFFSVKGSMSGRIVIPIENEAGRTSSLRRSLHRRERAEA